MSSFLNPLLSFVLLHKYVALFLIVYSGAIIVPFPVNAMLLAVGAFASQGYLSYGWCVLDAVVANCLGDITDYAITRKWGGWVIRVLRIDRVKFFGHLREELRDDAAITVFLTRFTGSMSSIANFLAGMVSVPFGTFAFYDLLGNIIEPGAALTIGYAAGNYWNDFSNFFDIIAAIIATAVVIFVLLRIHKRITKKYL